MSKQCSRPLRTGLSNYLTESNTNFLLLTNSQVLDICLDDPQGVGVTHAALPALDDNKGVALGHNLELQRLGHTPLDAAVDVLLPVDLGEVRLLLVEVEGVDAAVQVTVPGGRGVAGHHEDGADGAVLGEQAGGLARGREDNDTTSVEVQRGADRGHGARLDNLDGTLDKRAELLEVLNVWDGVLGLQASYGNVSVHVRILLSTGSGETTYPRSSHKRPRWGRHPWQSHPTTSRSQRRQ